MLKKKEDDLKLKKFLAKFTDLLVNIPLLEALQDMIEHVKFIKDLRTEKWVMEFEMITMTHICSAIMDRTIFCKIDSGTFTILGTIRVYKLRKTLCNNFVSIYLMPLGVFRNLGLGDPKPTTIRLLW